MVELIERDITPEELERVREGFRDHDLAHGTPPHVPVRISFVACDGERWVGCISGLTGPVYGVLTDLWLEPEYRRRGLGSTMLVQLETAMRRHGVARIYTWTAAYEAPGFYAKHGYHAFGELPQFYPAGHARVGLRKQLGAMKKSA